MNPTARHFFIENTLISGQEIDLPKPLYNRLAKVLRLKDGSEIILFNAANEAYCARFNLTTKTATLAKPLKIDQPRALTLFIGLPKKETFERVLRQATELGVTEIQPLLLDFCVPTKLNMERAAQKIIEAAEQCERLSLPALHAPTSLANALKTNTNMPLLWCNERGAKKGSAEQFSQMGGLIIGPEGGFSAEEIAILQASKNVMPFTLGKTILRVDTAVAAALGNFLNPLN